MKQYNVKIYDDMVSPHNIKVECDNVYDIDNVIGLPTFKYLNLSRLNSYNVFDLNNISYDNLLSQYKNFDNDKVTFLYIDDVLKYEQEYQTIVRFCIDYRIAVIVNAGSTLEEMGRCDKMYGLTPIGVLEEFGVLDLEPIILSGANLDKEDYEKINSILRLLDYESYLFWDELLNCYSGEHIRNKLFSLDEEKTSTLEKMNPYLENASFEELKVKLQKIQPKFLIGNVFNEDIKDSVLVYKKSRSR